MNGSLDGTSETLSRCRNFSLYFLSNPHSPVPQLTRPSLVFLSFWCEPDFTPIKDHTRETSGHQWQHGEYEKNSANWQNPASGPKSNSSHPNFSSDLNLGCNGNHTLMSSLSMYQYAAGLVSLMMVIKLWRWPEGVPHPAIFSRQHAPLCAHTRAHTHKQDFPTCISHTRADGHTHRHAPTHTNMPHPIPTGGWQSSGRVAEVFH